MWVPIPVARSVVVAMLERRDPLGSSMPFDVARCYDRRAASRLKNC